MRFGFFGLESGVKFEEPLQLALLHVRPTQNHPMPRVQLLVYSADWARGRRGLIVQRCTGSWRATGCASTARTRQKRQLTRRSGSAIGKRNKTSPPSSSGWGLSSFSSSLNNWTRQRSLGGT